MRLGFDGWRKHFSSIIFGCFVVKWRVPLGVCSHSYTLWHAKESTRTVEKCNGLNTSLRLVLKIAVWLPKGKPSLPVLLLFSSDCASSSSLCSGQAGKVIRHGHLEFKSLETPIHGCTLAHTRRRPVGCDLSNICFVVVTTMLRPWGTLCLCALELTTHVCCCISVFR